MVHWGYHRIDLVCLSTKIRYFIILPRPLYLLHMFTQPSSYRFINVLTIYSNLMQYLAAWVLIFYTCITQNFHACICFYCQKITTDIIIKIMLKTTTWKIITSPLTATTNVSCEGHLYMIYSCRIMCQGMLYSWLRLRNPKD